MKNIGKLILLVLLLAPVVAWGQAAGGEAAKRPVHKVRKVKRHVPVKVDPLAGIKCPAGSFMQDEKPGVGIIDRNGTGVMICSGSNIDASSATIYAGLQAFSFTKDGKTQNLTPAKVEGNFRIRAWKNYGLKIERVENLPVRANGKELRWVAISSRSAACEGENCQLTPEICALDTRNWDPAADTIKKARNISLNGAKYEPDFYQHLLAAALTGDRSAAHYLYNGQTLLKTDGAYGEALNAAMKVLSYARVICPGLPADQP